MTEQFPHKYSTEQANLHFHFVTLIFYAKSNLAILGGMKMQFWSFWKSGILIFGEKCTFQSVKNA